MKNKCLCKHYGTPQGCGYGDKCQFAHGYAELRSTSNQPMNPPMQMNTFNDKSQNNLINYKIAKCKNWEQDKTCRYGSKCTFAHGDEELRKKEDNLKSMNSAIPICLLDPNGNPFMIPPPQGFDFNQVPMQMIPPNFVQNHMMGMMPPGTNFPQGGNMEPMQKDSSGNNDKNQQ